MVDRVDSAPFDLDDCDSSRAFHPGDYILINLLNGKTAKRLKTFFG